MYKSKKMQVPESFYGILISDYFLDCHSHNLKTENEKPDVVFHIGAPSGLEPKEDAVLPNRIGEFSGSLHIADLPVQV